MIDTAQLVVNFNEIAMKTFVVVPSMDMWTRIVVNGLVIVMAMITIVVIRMILVLAAEAEGPIRSDRVLPASTATTVILMGLLVAVVAVAVGMPTSLHLQGQLLVDIHHLRRLVKPFLLDRPECHLDPEPACANKLPCTNNPICMVRNRK